MADVGSKSEAYKFAQQFLDKGLIVHLKQQKVYKDNLYFVFANDADTVSMIHKLEPKKKEAGFFQSILASKGDEDETLQLTANKKRRSNPLIGLCLPLQSPPSPTVQTKPQRQQQQDGAPVDTTPSLPLSETKSYITKEEKSIIEKMFADSKLSSLEQLLGDEQARTIFRNFCKADFSEDVCRCNNL